MTKVRRFENWSKAVSIIKSRLIILQQSRSIFFHMFQITNFLAIVQLLQRSPCRWSSQPDWGLGCLVASCSAGWSQAPLPVNLSVLPVWSIFRTKSYNVCLFHCLAGNSRIMRSIFQPFSTRCFFVLITKDNVRRTNTREKVVDDQEQCSWIGYWRRRKTISVMMN